MLKLRRKRGTQEGVVGLALRPDGFALVHLVELQSERPRLAICGTNTGSPKDRLAADLADAVRAQHLSGCAAVAALAQDAYGLWLLDAPDVQPAELAGAVRWLVQDLIDYPIDDAVTDYFELPQDVLRGRQRRVYVVAARAERVQGVIDAAAESGLTLGPIDITELALRNVAERLAPQKRGCALLQLGLRRGLLVVTRGHDLLLARDLDVGLDALGQPPPRASADEIPLEGEEGEQREALVLEVQRSLDYVESQLGQPPLDELFLAPLERPTPGLIEFLEKQLVARVRRFDLGELLEGGSSVPEADQARCLSAVGAALRVVSGES